MKAVLVIPTLDAGGAERAMTELAGFLAERGDDIVLATFEATGTQDFYAPHPAVRRVRLGNPQPAGSIAGKLAANWQRVQSLRRLLSAEKPAVLLGFMETANVLCLLAAAWLKLPVVVAERTDPAMHTAVPAAWRHGRRLLYRRATAIVAQTDAAASWLREHCGAAVHIIPNALRPLPPAGAARELLLLSVGRLEPVKGFDVLLRAFALVHSDFPAWQLAIVGEGAEGERLRALASALGLDQRVAWHGRTREIECWYARAAIVVQASRFEGFPNVVLEAMGMGAAVISTDCRSGPRELISSGNNGWLVPVDDEMALAGALRTLMADAGLRQRLGDAAMSVLQRFSTEHVLGQWRQLLAGAARRQIT